MGDENKQDQLKELERYDFLLATGAKEIFAQIDYALRQGQHIQHKHDKQTTLFNFIYANEESLTNYYLDFFHVNLSSNDADKFNKFYYLSFNPNDRGMVRKGRYEYMEKKHIIVGLVFWELYELDMNYPDTLTKFYEILFNHDLYKDSFIRLFAGIDSETEEMYEDKEIIKKEIYKAFENFESLGWVYFKKTDDDQKNSFVIMPSFRRLVEEQYKNKIENYHELSEKLLAND